MAEATYLLCAITSVVCAVLLIRGYVRTKGRLLLWTACCFTGLAINNIFLVLDAANPSVDLSLHRTLPAFVGMVLLVYGLVWESR